ncbi:lipocalin family protein [Sinomicrobium weinanense]|uniref:Lipocalin family protein n=1 Tax=Sinomicrobium weinanense TaxID=2842200 RepID=A0A926JRA1_9FLAO|nr:lipocalin family protein [Sinomicrobium weinanense]MBC9796050.1 lipocalin family protein [Sinomicrobium weinanense]MBU3123131.1 lipocalin family protein [Sinomicrobium weinanense]
MNLFRIRPVFAILYLIVFATWSCSTNPPEEQLQNIAGYWEIEKVELPDGQVKEYTVNTTVDYIEVGQDSTGFRKKLHPKPDGSFYASEDQEDFKLSIQGKQLSLQYRTSLSEWEENVIKATKDRLILRNTDNLKYFYKRFEPVDFGDR